MDPTRFSAISFGWGVDQTRNYGGTVVPALAGSALNLGDVVYWTTTANTVDKSTTQSLYTTFAGVVVGGDSYRNELVDPVNYPATGTIAVASSGGRVLVQTSGITAVIAAGTITAGNRIIPSGATAGRATSAVGSAILSGSATFDAASLADGAGETTTVTVTGAALGDFVLVSHGVDLQGITVTGYVSATNTVSVRFQNESGGTLDLASSTLRARVIPQAYLVTPDHVIGYNLEAGSAGNLMKMVLKDKQQ